jgi:hypothetical protein
MTGLLTAIATLITVLRTHSTVKVIENNTNGTLYRAISGLAAANQHLVANAAEHAAVPPAPVPAPAAGPTMIYPPN